MKTTRGLLGICLAAVLGAIPALADTPEAKGGKGKQKGAAIGKGWDAFAARFDANKDGKVGKDEFTGKQPGFDRVDANKDGVASADEINAARQAAAAKAAQAGRGKEGKGKKKGFVDRFDADKDGQVTLEEFNRGRGKGFDTMDKNKDGVVDKGEFEDRAKAAAEARGLVEEDE